MDSKHPPFDPPYTTTYGEGESRHSIETLVDGTTRAVASRQEVRPKASVVPQRPSDKTGKPAAAEHTAKTGINLTPGNKAGSLYLDVPFSEKEKAKRAGAKWDSVARKWFVPHGLDLNAFKRWWPEDLKAATKPVS
jgi:hypothetical protein